IQMFVFFSSRRRHTRFSRDWSSDVCSSDLEENRVLVNSILHHKTVILDEQNCKGLIFDLEHAQVLPDGSLDKSDRKDPTKQLDALDCFRYYCNAFHKHVLKL